MQMEISFGDSIPPCAIFQRSFVLFFFPCSHRFSCCAHILVRYKLVYLTGIESLNDEEDKTKKDEFPEQISFKLIEPL